MFNSRLMKDVTLGEMPCGVNWLHNPAWRHTQRGALALGNQHR